MPTWHKTFSLLTKSKRNLTGQKDLSGKTELMQEARAGIKTGLRAVRGLINFWILARKSGRNLSVALDRRGPARHQQKKPILHYCALVEASVNKKGRKGGTINLKGYSS